MGAVIRMLKLPEYDGPGVYKIKNNENGKIYIGSSINIKNRIKQHDITFRNRVNCNEKIKDDIIAGCSFDVEILEKLPKGIDIATLRLRERFFILQERREKLYNHPSFLPVAPAQNGTQARII